MITQLTINNFAIVDNLVVDFSQGMTAITGETGAGKSIAIDALGLCLGGRADFSLIRHGCDRLDISAHFSLDDAPSALNWLNENQLNDTNQCILRRIMNQDGRSKAFINGRAVPIIQLKELGQMLIHIHGQHQHQQLLLADYQQVLLDKYMSENALLSKMKVAYKNWQSATSAYQQHKKLQQQQETHIQLLQYQLKELNELSPLEGEYEQIDEEYKRLSNSEQLIHFSNQIINLLEENQDVNILNQLNEAKNTAQKLADLDSQLDDIPTMLSDASIQIKEASYELNRYVNNLDIDPARVAELEHRLSKIITLARKHQIQPNKLPELHQRLLTECEQIANQDVVEEELKQAIEKSYQIASICAEKLHAKRVKIAAELSEKITQNIQTLSMPHGLFSIQVNQDHNKMTETGSDQITFLVTTNPGQPLLPINKVASGGELSRIALTIQVLTAQKIETPALIFDEIDVGISGATAARVGNLLRTLGKKTQVITVTHLPQVAGNAHHHYFVTKQTKNNKTKTTMIKLEQQNRVQELARLLGGDTITENTLANANELLIG